MDKNEHIIEDQIYTEGNYVSVVFDSCKAYYFYCGDETNIVPGEFLVVETYNGPELAKCIEAPKSVKELPKDFRLKKLLRKATQDDLDQYKHNQEEAKKARLVFVEQVKKLNLDMFLLKCDYSLDCSKIIFLFSSDNRVDFRELVKTLAGILRCRIELRQVGSRDRSKIVGGIGPCGRELCCGSFLNGFDVISINMAKNQFLSLNTSKLSGQCGKLMCCLKYEDQEYTELRKNLPKINSRVNYEGNTYKITNINVLTNQVRIENNDSIVALPLELVMQLLESK